MKTYLLWTFLIIGFGFSSCKKDEVEPESYPYEAKVLGENLDCGIYSIRILKDLPSVESIVGTTIDSVYIANNLPEELQVSGLEIVLDLREPTNTELGLCTHLGPTYNWLTVIRAKRK